MPTKLINKDQLKLNSYVDSHKLLVIFFGWGGGQGVSLEAKYIAGTKTEDESDISFLMSEDSTFILSCLTDSPDVKRIMKTIMGKYN